MNVCDRMRTVKVRSEEYQIPCGSRYCAVCGKRWMQDQRIVAVAGAEHVVGDVGLVTITGPGDRYFDRLCRERGWKRRHAVRVWNASARRRFRRLHQRASAAPRKWDRRMGSDWRVLYRVWEYQKRGVLHVHIVVPMGSWGERCASRRYLRALCDLRDTYGFGYVLGGDASEEAGSRRYPTLARVPRDRAARYVAKYVSATGAGKESMQHTARRTASRGSVLFVSPWLTRQSGVTNTTLRNRRRIWARYPWARDSAAGWRAARLVDAVQRGRPPLTRDAVLALRRGALRWRPDRWVDTRTGQCGGLTAAPCPLSADRNLKPRPTDGGDLQVALASVLDGVSHEPWLGPWRTDVAAPLV